MTHYRLSECVDRRKLLGGCLLRGPLGVSESRKYYNCNRPVRDGGNKSCQTCAPEIPLSRMSNRTVQRTESLRGYACSDAMALIRFGRVITCASASKAERQEMIVIHSSAVGKTNGDQIICTSPPGSASVEVIVTAKLVLVQPVAHIYGELYCPERSRDGHIVRVLSTPRNPENHAKRIRRAVDRCNHN